MKIASLILPMLENTAGSAEKTACIVEERTNSVTRADWWYRVLDFSVQMIDRFEAKDRDGWKGYEVISEEQYQDRAIKNIKKGDYVDAANLCLLAKKYGIKTKAERSST